MNMKSLCCVLLIGLLCTAPPAWAQKYPYFSPGGALSCSPPCSTQAVNLAAGAPYITNTLPQTNILTCAANQIVYDNASAALTCSATITWTDSTHTLSLGGGNVTVQSVTATSTGTSLTLAAASGSTVGGNLFFNSGSSSAGNAGELSFNGGNGGGASGAGAPMVFTGGGGAGTGTGGSVSFTGGASVNAKAGSYGAIGGSASGTGNGGDVSATSGISAESNGGGGLTAPGGIAGATAVQADVVLNPNFGQAIQFSGGIALEDFNGDKSLYVDPYGNVICACATSAAATDQFLYLGASSGVPTGVPAHITGIYANSIPVRYDTTDNRLYAYNSGWQNVANTAQAHSFVTYQPGFLSALVTTKSAFHKAVKSMTVNNLEGSAQSLNTCGTNPTITLYECSTSTTCASPTTIGSVTITATGQVFNGTVSAGSILGGDYFAFAISAGACTSLDISATAEVSTN